MRKSWKMVFNSEAYHIHSGITRECDYAISLCQLVIIMLIQQHRVRRLNLFIRFIESFGWFAFFMENVNVILFIWSAFAIKWTLPAEEMHMSLTSNNDRSLL